MRFVLAAAAFAASSALALAQPLEIPPQEVPIKVLGVELAVPVSGTLDVKTEAGRMTATVDGVANLQSLQQNATALAQRIPLPKAECPAGAFATRVGVEAIDTAMIMPDGDAAKIVLIGRAKVFLCTPLGYTTLDSDLTVSGSIVPEVSADGQTGKFRLTGEPEIVGNNLGGEAIAALAGVIGAELRTAIDNALDISDASAKIPQLPGMTYTINSVAFFAEEATLMVRANITASLNGETVVHLLSLKQ